MDKYTQAYNQLRNSGLSHNGACAVMGNIQCESAFRSDNMQDCFERGGINDEIYTQRVDEGYPTIGNLFFMDDQCGYGYFQHTHPSRKAGLLDTARRWGVSIANAEMQIWFGMYELYTQYHSVYNYLCGDCDLYTATERVCKEFERPAVNNVDARFEAAQKFAAQFDGFEVQTHDPTEDIPMPTANEIIAVIEDNLAMLKALLGG